MAEKILSKVKVRRRNIWAGIFFLALSSFFIWHLFLFEGIVDLINGTGYELALIIPFISIIILFFVSISMGFECFFGQDYWMIVKEKKIIQKESTEQIIEYEKIKEAD